jgi:hypothetical protein
MRVAAISFIGIKRQTSPDSIYRQALNPALFDKVKQRRARCFTQCFRSLFQPSLSQSADIKRDGDNSPTHFLIVFTLMIQRFIERN